jgi:hypothetical protein
MIEPIISKTDLLSRLNEIYNQLEELQDVLHSSYLIQQGNVQKLEKNALDSCNQKLSNLEMAIMNRPEEMEKKTVSQAVGVKNKTKTSGLHLELGLKSI